MINKLIIKNFQSHKSTELEFHPNVNCIVGSSDVGKSAILRALRWIVFNRPSGESFRSWWGGPTKATVFTNGNKISRLRSKTGNCYYLNGKLLDAPRSEVPEDIQTALNISEINIQKQFDRPFLFAESSGEVARHFNMIAHIDDIDTSTRWLQSEIRDLQRSEVLGKKQVEFAQEEVDRYKDFDKTDELITKLETVDKEKRTKEAQAVKIESILSQYEAIIIASDALSGVLSCNDKVDTVLKLKSRLKAVSELINNLNNCVNALKRINRESLKYGKWDKLSTTIAEVSELMEQKKRTENNARAVLIVHNAINQMDKKISSQKIILKQAKQKFEDEFPEICPLCGK